LALSYSTETADREERIILPMAISGQEMPVKTLGESCYTQRVTGALMDDVKEQLKVLILRSLRITDVSPAELSDDRVLMGGDLEIDSIDVLQLILEIERHFGIKLVKGGKFEKAEWATVGTLADAIEARLVEATKK
jgi:acyl carrier protein